MGGRRGYEGGEGAGGICCCLIMSEVVFSFLDGEMGGYAAMHARAWDKGLKGSFLCSIVIARLYSI